MEAIKENINNIHSSKAQEKSYFYQMWINKRLRSKIDSNAFEWCLDDQGENCENFKKEKK